MTRSRKKTHPKAGKVLTLPGADLAQRRVQVAFASAHEAKGDALMQVKAAIAHHQTIINAFEKVANTLGDLS